MKSENGYALVNLNGVPKIVQVYDSLLDAIVARNEMYTYRHLHIFRLITANGIQELFGKEKERERLARQQMLEKEMQKQRQS